MSVIFLPQYYSEAFLLPHCTCCAEVGEGVVVGDHGLLAPAHTEAAHPGEAVHEARVSGDRGEEAGAGRGEGGHREARH